MQPFIKTCQECGSSSHYDGIVKSLSNINVALLDTVYYHLVDSWPLETNLVWAEEDFWGFELFGA